MRVDVGYYALGAGPGSLSRGTRASLVGAALGGGFAFRDGALRTVRPAERVRDFKVRGKLRPAISVGGAEHFGLPAAYPRLAEVNVYLGWLGPLARVAQAASLGGSVVGKIPGVAALARVGGEQLMARGTGPAAGTTPGGLSWIAASGLRRRRRKAGRGPPVGRRRVRLYRRLPRLGRAESGARGGRGDRRCGAVGGVRARGAALRLRGGGAAARAGLSTAVAATARPFAIGWRLRTAGL